MIDERFIVLKHINEHINKINSLKTYLSEDDYKNLENIESILDKISIVGV